MKRIRVESSNIHSVSHNRRKNTMTITFRPKDGASFKTAAVYQYHPVTHEQAMELATADSVGGHFAKHFRRNEQVTYKKVR